MKKVFPLIVLLCCLACSSCKSKNEPEEFKLTGTYWAYESSVSGTVSTWYYYYVWHFISETEGEEIRYSTDTRRVDIAKGEDPAKYGTIPTDNDKVVIHCTLNYPNITTYETVTYYYTQVTEDKNYCEGEFISNDMLALKFPKTGMYRYFHKISK